MNLTEINLALKRFVPPRIDEDCDLCERAAVAMVLGGPAESLSMCFILKTHRAGDQWSGQMALPGGWAEPRDGTTRSAAIRETREEVGLRLEDRQCIGALSERRIPSRGDHDRESVLSPYVFYIGERLPTLRPAPLEVADAYWIPVNHLWHASNATSLCYESIDFPAIAFEDQVIWGLTLWILESFRALVNGE